MTASVEMWESINKAMASLQNLRTVIERQGDWIAKLAAALEPFSKMDDCGHVRELLEQAKAEGAVR